MRVQASEGETAWCRRCAARDEEAAVNVLEDILRDVRLDVAAREAKIGMDEIRAAAQAAPGPLNGYLALRAPGVAVIAEVKRRSPSRGRSEERRVGKECR